jgi:hypothetical protein
MASRKAIEQTQHNHSWHLERAARGSDLLIGRRGGPRGPAGEVERLVLLVHHTGGP